MRTTIKDIAAATGLSVTTVSLVLNHKPSGISSATRAVSYTHLDVYKRQQEEVEDTKALVRAALEA